MSLPLDNIPSSFTFQYMKTNPGATEDDIRKAYHEQQGKQAMNTRLLGG